VQQSDPLGPEPVDGCSPDAGDLGNPLLRQRVPTLLQQHRPRRRQGAVAAALNPAVDRDRGPDLPVLRPALVGQQVWGCLFRNPRPTT